MDYKFKKILIGYDNSNAANAALDKALQTCRAFGSDLYVVNVKTSKPQQDDYSNIVKEKALSYAVKIFYIERKGDVSKEITKAERDLGADLIFIGAKKREGFNPIWRSNNSSRVLHSSSCPVITVLEGASDAKITDIILPLDDSMETRQKVPYAVILARGFNATIHILAVSKDEKEDTKRRLVAYTRQTEEYFDKHDVRYTIELKQGHQVTESCINYGIEKKAGLIMMMTGIGEGGFLKGSIARQLINSSPIPICAIHSRDMLLSGASGY